jgi:hypothetical protein
MTASAAAKIGGVGLFTKIVGAGLVVVAVAGGAFEAGKRAERAENAEMVASASANANANATPNAPRTALSTPSELEPAASAPMTRETSTPALDPKTVAAAASETRPAAASADVTANGAPIAAAPTVAPSTVPTSTLAATATGASDGGVETALGREMKALDVARSALARGDSAGAMIAIDQYDRDFSSGNLATEASVLRVEALVARGETAAARALAAHIVALDPAGPQAQRMKAIARGSLERRPRP